MGCKEEDTIVRSIADFEVPDVLVCLPSFKMFSWFFFSRQNLRPLTSLSSFPRLAIFDYSC